LDLTTNNILITLGANMKIYLIDFGKITNINEAGSDNFFNAEEKRLIKEQQEKYKQRIHFDKDKDKAQLVYSICTYISNLEKNFTQKINRESKKNNTYQMDWIENFFSLLETDKQTICSDVFELLMSDIIRIDDVDPDVTSRVRDGSIITFDLSKPVVDYYVSISPPLIHKGGKKMKKHKKSRKTKRHKKMKKHRKTIKYKKSNKY
jgi:hypothetical protein